MKIVVEGGVVQEVYGDAITVHPRDLACLDSGTREDVQVMMGCLDDEGIPATPLSEFPRAEIEARRPAALTDLQHVVP